jgi:Arc/MetJ family transcription regulator
MARTVGDINDELLKKAQKLTGINKKVEVVNYAL